MKPLPTHYKALGVTPGAPDAEIREAYKKLAVRWHPDKPGGDQERFSRITEAYATLKDGRLRREYDAKLRVLYAICLDCDGLGHKIRAVSFTKSEKRTCERCMGAGFMEKK